MPSRHGRKLLLSFGGGILAVLLMETGLRVASYAGLYLWEADAHIGWRGYPHAEGRSRESKLWVRLNSQGFHDREHSKEKPPNTLRIAVLGDSVTQATEVPIEKKFTAVMERALTGCPLVRGRTVEVLNFGVRGYGTAQELLTLRRIVWEYDPDIVVLAFFTGNDLTDDSPSLANHIPRPYFVHWDGKLVLDDSQAARYSLLERLRYQGRLHFRVWQVASEARAALRKRAYPTNPMTDQVVDEQVYREPADPAWQEAWRVTEELILLMREEVLVRGAQFLVVTLSTPIQVHPDPTLRERYMKHLGVQTLFYPDFRIRALGEREGIAVLTLAPTLQAYAERHGGYLHGFSKNLGRGHWNEEGHRLAGEMLAQKACAEVLAPQEMQPREQVTKTMR